MSDRVVDEIVNRYLSDADIIGGAKAASDYGLYYQTAQDPKKEKQFQEWYQKKPTSEISNVVTNTMAVFENDIKGLWEPEDFKRLIAGTIMHESGGGKYRRQLGQDNRPLGGYVGGFGLPQIEISTARDIVTAIQSDGSTNVSSAYWGKKAEKITGYSSKDIFNMGDEQLSRLLQNDDKVATVFAMAKYIKAAKHRRQGDNYGRI